MKGSRMCTIATSTAKRLSSSGSGSATSPAPSSAEFTIPSFCSSTIQAAVRTIRLVQNGSSTPPSSQGCARAGASAISQASG